MQAFSPVVHHCSYPFLQSLLVLAFSSSRFHGQALYDYVIGILDLTLLLASVKATEMIFEDTQEIPCKMWSARLRYCCSVYVSLELV